MLASVLNRKCGSICACSASMRASSTVRSSCSVSARLVASLAVSSALRLPPATTLMMKEAMMRKKTGVGCLRMPASIRLRNETSSSAFHEIDGQPIEEAPTTSRRCPCGSRAGLAGFPSAARRDRSCRGRRRCRCLGCVGRYSSCCPLVACLSRGKITGGGRRAPARQDTMRAGRDEMQETVIVGDRAGWQTGT